MRRISAQIEALRPAAFVFLIGLVAGTIQGVPRLLLGGVTSSPPKLFPFLVIGATAILWWTAALLLWWIILRRQPLSLWIAAGQVTLGLAIGETLAAALGVVASPVDPFAPVTIGLGQQLLAVVYSGLFLTLFRSPLWFVGAVVAIALGRDLNVAQQSAPTASTPAAAHPGSVA
jgi:hypothetical protein